MAETENKKIYEVGYHILPTLSEEEVAKVVTSLKDVLAGFEASVIAEQYPTLMTLAYQIGKDIENKNRKFGTAYFGWIKFEVATESIDSFKDSMEKNPNILRFIIIKTVRESTLATPRIAHKGGSRRGAPDSEAVAPMNKEEVDKKIDAMIEEDKEGEVLPETL
jgi:ribosomal protein S6